MATMGKYYKAYPIQQLRQFNNWTKNLENTRKEKQKIYVDGKEVEHNRKANFETQTGEVHLVGNLTLNYEKLRCIADLDLQTLSGQGHLELIEEAVSLTSNT